MDLSVLGWVVGGGVGLLVLDRFLLWCEARGWLYYRNSKPGRGASAYHFLEMSSIFEPSLRVAQEIMVSQEEQEDEAGDPVGGDEDDEPIEKPRSN